MVDICCGSRFEGLATLGSAIRTRHQIQGMAISLYYRVGLYLLQSSLQNLPEWMDSTYNYAMIDHYLCTGLVQRFKPSTGACHNRTAYEAAAVPLALSGASRTAARLPKLPGD